MFEKSFKITLILVLLSIPLSIFSQGKHGKWTISVMEYNVENLFDCQHDSLKDDFDYLPEGKCQWTPSKYWRKLNAVARGIVLGATQNEQFTPPDLVGLCEVENDSVLYALTHRSLLKGAGYEYVMTDSPDQRGVDVALLYQPVSFSYEKHYGIRVDTIPGMRKTRDILYVKGRIKVSEDGLADMHVFVVHAPSRRGGETVSRPFRLHVAERLMQSVDSLRAAEPEAKVLIMGDFNDYDGDAALEYIISKGMTDVSTKPYLTKDAKVKGTYRYRGEWGSLDHIFLSKSLCKNISYSRIAAHPDLLEEDTKFGGYIPYRFFRGPVVHGGYSDHLPLLVEFMCAKDK